jgi:hypothetical protein
VLVRDNSWLFGEGFHFTMAEAGLTKIMQRVSEELSLKRAKGAKGLKPDGKIGRIDSFMGRLVPHEDVNHREFLLIELKRPSLKITRKELDQLEDYVTSILAQPDLVNASTNWNFYLVTSEYDDVVKERIVIRRPDVTPAAIHPGQPARVAGRSLAWCLSGGFTRSGDAPLRVSQCSTGDSASCTLRNSVPSPRVWLVRDQPVAFRPAGESNGGPGPVASFR